MTSIGAEHRRNLVQKGRKMSEVKNEELDEEIIEVASEDEVTDEAGEGDTFNCFNCFNC